jgi:hypothetical protein
MTKRVNSDSSLLVAKKGDDNPVHLPSDVWISVLHQVVKSTEILISWHMMLTGWAPCDTRDPLPADTPPRREQRWQFLILCRVCRQWSGFMLGGVVKQLRSLEWGTAMLLLRRQQEQQQQEERQQRVPLDTKALPKHCPSLTYLDVSPVWGNVTVSNDLCQNQLNQFSHLTALNLRFNSQCVENRPRLLAPDFSNLTNLRSLSMRGNNISTFYDIAPLIPTLTELDCSGSLWSFRMDFLDQFTTLRSLTIVDNPAVHMYTLHRMTQLTRLDLRGLPKGPVAPLSTLFALTQLTALTLSERDIPLAQDRAVWWYCFRRELPSLGKFAILDHHRPFPFPYAS